MKKLASAHALFAEHIGFDAERRSRSFRAAISGLAIVGGLAAGGAYASAAILTYDVNMNFDPDVQEGGPGVGTVTGSFSIDTSTTTIVALDLVEATNNGANNIGGAYGSPTYATFTFADTGAYNVYASATVGQKSYEFGGDPYLFVSVWTNSAVLDGVLIGPTLQFDFAYPQGGSVQPGNFDSITSENKYLFGPVTPASAAAAPEASTWTMMLAGLAGLGGLGAAKRRRRKQSLAVV
jgi:hypothetical protein